LQFKQLNKLLSTNSSEDAILALKIIESKITIKHALAAACLIRRSNIPESCQETTDQVLLHIHNILAIENGKILEVRIGSAKAYFNYALSCMRSKEDAEYTYDWYKDHINDIYLSAVALKLPPKKKSK
jgi:hypothetical protein